MVKARRHWPITGTMTVTDALTRITQLTTTAVPPPAADAAPPATSATASAFADLLSLTGGQDGLGGLDLGALSGLTGLSGLAGLTATPTATASTAAARMLQLAAAEVGQGEQPPGTNDSARISQYRTATAGSGVGPWCAYFTSWVAQQAGVPLGEVGQGFGSVEGVAGWAQRTGRWTPAAPGIAPQPGDLIVWGGRHIGIVESVGPDGSISTIEGNSSNAVSRRTYGPDGGGATGYVRVG